jgi:MFS family permease
VLHVPARPRLLSTPAEPVAGPRTPSEAPADRWIALATYATALALAMTTWFSATAVVPQLRDEWGLSAPATSWLTISVQLGFVLGAVVSAATNLADIVAPRRLMLLGTLGAAAANILLLTAEGLALAVPLRLLTGASLALVYPPALKAMATWFRTGRGTALGVMLAALTLGSALPHLVTAAGGLDWRLVVVTTSLLTLVGGVVAETRGRDGPFPFPAAVFDPRQLGRVLRDRRVMLASTGYFGHMWELYAMWAWFSPFMSFVLAREGWSSPGRTAALITFAVIGVGAVGCWFGGVLSDRWGRVGATSLAMICSGAAAATIGFLGGRAPVALVVAVGLFWGFWVIADSAQFSAAVTEVAEQRYVGTALTLQLAIGFTLTVVTIWLVPVVRDAAGWGWAFLLLAPGPAVGTLAMQRLRSAPAPS